VWRDEVSGCIQQNHVFRMRPYLSDVLPELISHHGNTVAGAHSRRTRRAGTGEESARAQNQGGRMSRENRLKGELAAALAHHFGANEAQA